MTINDFFRFSGCLLVTAFVGWGCTTDDVDTPAPIQNETELYLVPDAAFGEYLMYLQIDGVQAQVEEGVTLYYIDPSLVDGVSELAMSKTSGSVENLTEAGYATAETKITNLDGIQYFVNLQTLKITSNALTSLDLSACSKLVTLEMNFNLVGTLDLSSNPALERFRYKASANADENQKLSSIDLSANAALRHLYLPRHNLTSIDLSNNPLVDDTLDLSENPGPDGDPDTADIVVPDAIFNQVPEESRAGVISDAGVETLVSISTDKSVLEESGDSATITATLNTTSDEVVSLSLSLSGTAEAQTDYTLDPLVLSIPAGETTASATVATLDDDEEEGGETIVVTLSEVTGAEAGAGVELSITITDDDFPLNLVLNEILYDPWNSGLNGDANGDGSYLQAEDEFIELVNMGSAAVDLSGFEFYDAESLEAGIPSHVVAEGTTLEPGKAFVLFGGGTPTGEFGGALVAVSTSGDLNLNNSRDVLTILDAEGLNVLTFDIEPLSNNPNESYTRSPDLTGDFFQHADVSEVLFSPGTRIDGSSF